MPHINLLPWREERRKEQQIEFIIALAVVAVAGVVIWGMGHLYHTQLMNVQDSRNVYIKSQIEQLDKKIEEIKKLEEEKERLLARMRAIEQLQGNRPLIVRLFDELVTAMPEGVSLNSIKQKGGEIVLTGVAQSNARVSSFMRNIKNSEWIQNPNLQIIQADEPDKNTSASVSDFTLSFSQVLPKEEEE